jgi:hypothetical protein
MSLEHAIYDRRPLVVYRVSCQDLKLGIFLSFIKEDRNAENGTQVNKNYHVQEKARARGKR